MRWRRSNVVELAAARDRVEVLSLPTSGRPLVGVPPRYPSGTPLELAQIDWLPFASGLSRMQAITIPAVMAARNLICGTVCQLELYRYRSDVRLDPGYLLTKPDPSTAITQTLSGTVDDLLFYGHAYWRVLERDSTGLPTRARWTPVIDVTVNSESTGGSYVELESFKVAGVDGIVPVEDMIRFDGYAPALLVYGGPVLFAALELEQAAQRLAAVELPAGTLTNEGSELGEQEAADLVQNFQEARRSNGIAFLQGVTYSRENMAPADLQLIEARNRVDSDVARLTGVPVAMLAASPSGNSSAMLYQNLAQQKATLVTTAVAPHLRVIEKTLSDILPRGQSCAFDVQTYLRADPEAAADYVLKLMDGLHATSPGVITQDEARSMLGLPPAERAPGADILEPTNAPPPPEPVSPPAASNDLTPGRV